jgi:hypothetical protein
MFRSSKCRSLVLCLAVWTLIGGASFAVEKDAAHRAVTTQRSSFNDVSKWIMNRWENRWVPAERHLERRYV